MLFYALNLRLLGTLVFVLGHVMAPYKWSHYYYYYYH